MKFPEVQLYVDDDDMSQLVAQEVAKSVYMLEQRDREHGIPIWFFDKDKDNEAVDHLVHCLKVVHDWFSAHHKYFDYSEAD